MIENVPKPSISTQFDFRLFTLPKNLKPTIMATTGDKSAKTDAGFVKSSTNLSESTDQTESTSTDSTSKTTDISGKTDAG